MSEHIAARALEATIDAERAALGSILVNGQKAFDLVVDVLGENASKVWFRKQHEIAWQVIARLAALRTSIDLVTVATALTSEEEHELSKVYLSSLLDSGYIVSNVSAYAQIIIDAWQRREMARIAREVIDEANLGETTVSEMVEGVESQLFDLRKPTKRTEVLSPTKRAGDLMSTLDERIARKGAIKNPTRLTEVDGLTRGFKPGQLWVVGARPGMGKSALAMTLAVNATPRGAEDVAGFVSLEMSAEELGMRELALRGKIPFWRIDAGLIRPDDPRLKTAFDGVAEAGLHLIDIPGATVAAIRRAARRLSMLFGERFKLLFVDYIQLVKLEKGQFYGNRAVEVGLVSGGLKELARELGITIVALSQLKRPPEGEKPKRPTLTDFRESGNLEQDADIALLLHREGYYDRENDAIQNQADLDLAKQRNGPTGLFALTWHAEEMRFSDSLGGQTAHA